MEYTKSPCIISNAHRVQIIVQVAAASAQVATEQCRMRRKHCRDVNLPRTEKSVRSNAYFLNIKNEPAQQQANAGHPLVKVCYDKWLVFDRITIL